MDVTDIRKANFAELLRLAGGPTAFAAQIDRSPNYVTQLGKPYKAFGHPIARHIEKMLGKPHGWMDTPQFLLGRPLEGATGTLAAQVIKGPGLHPVSVPAFDIRAVDDEDEPAGEDDVLVDLVDIRLSAGGGGVVPEFVPTKRRLTFSRYWLEKKRLRETAVKVMPVRGESMEPRLTDGGTVLINTADRDRIIDGRIYALILGRESKVKTLRWRADGALIVHSENPDKAKFPDEVIPQEEMHNVYIIGRAVQQTGDL